MRRRDSGTEKEQEGGGGRKENEEEIEGQLRGGEGVRGRKGWGD